jgi:hypothetical protein
MPSPAQDIPLDDYRWLVSDAAKPWLALAGQGSDSTLALVQTFRKELSPARTHLAIEQAELRQRASEKFSAAERMFFTPLGLQQASDEKVSGYKAGRFPADEPLADLCCGIGGDLLALARRGAVVGVERDPVSALLAKANLAANRLSGSVAIEDAAEVNVAACAAWHIDPDRRPSGRRTTRVELHEPGLDVLERLLSENEQAAIKLAPAATFPDAWAERAELEWISRRGSCRQLVAWFGALASHRGQRRASIVGGDADDVHTLVGMANVEIPPRAIGRYVMEPDVAVLAARLTGELAARYDLGTIARGIAYLTSDHPVVDPALALFEVTDVLPYNVKRIKALLRQRGIGRLEVKKRGVAHDPREVQKLLRVPGDQRATLIVTRMPDGVTAILARRVEK